MRAFLITFSLIFSATGALGDTYKCDAVDDLARLGYDGVQKVSIVGKDKVCKFSIGDASADGASPNINSQQGQSDRELLALDPEQFFAHRLANIIYEASIDLGEPAEFVVKNLKEDTDLSDLSCAQSNTLSIESLEIRCFVLNNANAENPQVFENGVITAVLFRRKFIFEIRDVSESETALVIFILKTQ